MWTDRIEDLVDKHPMPWELQDLYCEGKSLGMIIIDANANQVKLEEIVNAFTPAGSEK